MCYCTHDTFVQLWPHTGSEKIPIHITVFFVFWNCAGIKVYTGIFVRTFVYLCLYLRMCAYICVFVYLCVHLRICAYICVFVATFAYVYIHTCVFVCTFAYLCAHPARGQPHPYHSVPRWSSAVSRTPHSLLAPPFTYFQPLQSAQHVSQYLVFTPLQTFLIFLQFFRQHAVR